MTENCVDIGTIQAFLDGELASDRLEAVSRHISFCDNCAILLAEAEEESAIAFTALDAELNGFVPTNRLWTKINDSIENQKKPFWQTVFAYFSNPSIATFASLLIVIGLFATLLILKSDGDKKLVAEVLPSKQTAILPVNNPGTIGSVERKPTQILPEIKSLTIVETSANENNKTKYSAVKAAFSTKEIKRQPEKSGEINRTPRLPINVETRGVGDSKILGEESYVKTIAALTKTVNGSKDEVLKPSARFAFERDLAVTDDAIKKMKAEVEKNPKNEAAKDVLRASYQNKIDLLNSVAEKSELMASLK